MEKSKKGQAEKLQTKLDELLQKREKKQQTFEKAKQELSAVSKNVDITKLKLFEILQSGSDDIEFSNWAKRKIGESENAKNTESVKDNNGKADNPKSVSHDNGNVENAITANHKYANSANPQKPATQNHQPHTGQN